MRDADAQPLSPRRATVLARHSGGGPGLVEEDQTGGIEIWLTLEPGVALLQDIGAILLGGVRVFF